MWGRQHVGRVQPGLDQAVQWLLDLRRRLESNGGEVRTTHGLLRTNDIGAYFLSSSPVMEDADPLPLVASAYVTNEMVIPEDMTILHIRALNSARSEEGQRLSVRHPNPRILCAVVKYGFMEMPDLTDLISEQTIRRQDRWRIVVGSESLSVDDEAGALTKMGVGLFKFQMNLSQPAAKYLFPETLDLDLHILKVGVPVVFETHGAQSPPQDPRAPPSPHEGRRPLIGATPSRRGVDSEAIR